MKIKLDPGAFMPEYAYEQDAGMDLRSPVDMILRPMDSVIIDTGVHVELPHGYAGVVQSKSGLFFKHNIITTGLVDEGYSGSIRVKLWNLGRETYEIMRGDKIAQLVVYPVLHPELELVDSMDETERGDNGFGSTGR